MDRDNIDNNELKKNVGLIVWGCKGGYQVFCSHNIDVQDVNIRNTIKDVRGSVRFNRVNVVAYAVEFTDVYQVFTIYRSSYDNGFGAYVAFSIYVPHKILISNLREQMKKAMDDYFMEYVNLASGSHLLGKRVTIEFFYPFLRSLTATERKVRFRRTVSKQDNIPSLLVYQDEKEVDEYFKNPYCEEFFECQEVLFLSQQLLDEGDRTLYFNIEPRRIDKPSHPVEMPKLNLGVCKEVVNLKINGKDCKTTDSHPVDDSDEVSITFQKKYHKDAVKTGTLSALINDKVLKVGTNGITLGSERPSHKPKEYCFQLTTLLFDEQKRSQFFWISDNQICLRDKDNNRISIKNATFTVLGDCVEQNLSLGIFPYKDAREEFVIKSFTPKDYLESDESTNKVELEVREFAFRYNNNSDLKKVEVNLASTNNRTICTIMLEGENGSMTIYLPKKEADPIFSSKNTNVKCEYDKSKHVLSLIKKKSSSALKTYTLDIPDEVKEMVNSLDFKLKQNSLKIENDFQFKCSPEDINALQLFINGQEYTYSDNQDQLRLSPWMMVVCSSDGKTVKIKLKEGLEYPFKRGIYPINNGNFTVVTKGYQKTEYNGCVFIIKPAQNSPTPGPIPTTNTDRVTFHKCKGFTVRGEDKECKIPKDERELTLSSQELTILDQRGKDVCYVFAQQDKYDDEKQQFNKQHGFTVEYKDGAIEVRYKPRNFLSKLSASFHGTRLNRKWVLLSVVVALGTFGTFFLKYYLNSSKPFCVVQFELKDKNFGAELEVSEPEKNSLLKLKGNELLLFNRDSIDKIESMKIDYEVSVGQIKLSESYRLKKLKLRQYEDSQKTDTTRIALNNPIKTKLDNEKWTTYTDSALFLKLDELFDGKWKACDTIASYLYSKLKPQRDPNAIHKYFGDSGIEKTIPMQNDLDSVGNNILRAVEQAKADSIHKANIRAEAGRYKQKLWDINCSKRTVDEVEGWWNKLSNEDQKIIRGIYDFKKGIALYKAFFQATRKEDLTVIITIKNQRYIHKYCFSDDQWIVISQGYAKDSETFKKYKSVFGEVRFGRDVLNVAKQKNNENSN